MRPELVIFDCDGVLVDTEPTTNAALAANLTRHGLRMSTQDCLDSFVGGTMKDVMAQAQAMGADFPDDWLDEIYPEMFAALARGVPVIPGALDIIAACERHGIQTCIVSNGPMAKMRVTLTPSGLWDRFEGRIWSAHEHGAPKPEPDMVLDACARFQVVPENAAMIDDGDYGVAAAIAAGVRAIGYNDTGPPGRLSGSGVTECGSMQEVARELRLE